MENKIKKGIRFIIGIFDICVDMDGAIKTYIGSKPKSAWQTYWCQLNIHNTNNEWTDNNSYGEIGKKVILFVYFCRFY